MNSVGLLVKSFDDTLLVFAGILVYGAIMLLPAIQIGNRAIQYFEAWAKSGYRLDLSMIPLAWLVLFLVWSFPTIVFLAAAAVSLSAGP